MKRRAAIYTRLSRDSDGLSTSTQEQEKECRALAKRLGWEVAVVHTDLDVPASEAQATRRRKRKAYASLLKDLDEGRVNAVIVWMTDRLYRHPRDLEDLIDLLDQKKVQVRTVRSGDLDLTTPDGRAYARTQVVWSKREVEVMGERIARSHRARAAEGQSNGGMRPFGMKVKKTTDPRTGRPKERFTNEWNAKEAKAIVDAARRVLDGQSTSSIARLWNKRGLRTGWGNTWTHKTVRDVLLNPRIAGIYIYRPKDGEPIETRAAWPALIDKRTFARLQDALDADKRRSGWMSTKKHLLTGLTFCAECGDTMKTRYTAGKRNFGCHGAIRAQPLEEHVIGAASRVELVQRASVPEPDDPLIVERDDVQKRLDELADAFAAGEIDRTQLARATSKLRTRLEALDAQLVDRGVTQSKFSWRALANVDDDPTRDRMWLEKLIERIVVHPAGRRNNIPIGERVTIEWRPGVEPVEGT